MNGQPPQDLVIRADATPSMGTGHLLRSLALAQAWLARGRKVDYVSHCPLPPLVERLKAAGCGVRLLHAPHPDPEDAAELLAATRPGQWVALDGYHLETGYQRALRRAGRRVLLLDDVRHLNEYDADVLLNQNIHARDWTYAGPPEMLRLLGPDYVLLRSEFTAEPGRTQRPRVPLRILCTMGGADPLGMAALVLQALALLPPDSVEAVLLAGPANPRQAELRAAVPRCPQKVRLLAAVDDMRELMEWADLALTAAGSTCWELAHMGVPMLAVTVAGNQEGIARELERAGAALDLGLGRNLSASAIAEAVQRVNDPSGLRRMGEAGRGLIDGHGAARVADILDALAAPRLEAAPLLRRAGPGDCRAVFNLANDPTVRAHSFQAGPISWDGHVRWYERLLGDPDRALYLAVVGGVLAGQIRFDRAGERADLGFSVAAPFRGKGLGAGLLRDALPLACRDLGVAGARGLVLPGNEASLRAFVRAGYVRDAHDTSVDGRTCAVFTAACGGQQGQPT
jgi:UDP-2,4-diacetamido-2,4,6-trideoxy-beta-L-altropyranose hydrolase